MLTRAVSIGLAAALLVACSGDDDDDDEGSAASAPPSSEAIAPTTTVADAAEETTTESSVAPTPTVEVVTEGATVVVANSSIIGGSAGRMTEELTAAGFTTRRPVNGTDRLPTSVVYYTDAEGAEAVAASVGQVLGGVAVEPLPDEIPTQNGRLRGAQVLVMLGNAQADRTLEELEQSGAVETSGSVVVVANAAGIDGAATAMTAELEFAGFAVGTPTNGTGQRTDSIVYHTDAEGASEDAELLAELLGGVDVEPLPDEIPTESGELEGDVLLLLGTNQAEEPLDTSGS